MQNGDEGGIFGYKWISESRNPAKPGEFVTTIAHRGDGYEPRKLEMVNVSGQKTYYRYDGAWRLIQTVYPEANSIINTLDARGNILSTTATPKPGSGLAPIVTMTASYPATCINYKTCNKPEWVRDANNAQTDYTYDPVHGGVLTETGPVDANGVRPQTRYTYAPSTPGTKTQRVRLCRRRRRSGSWPKRPPVGRRLHASERRMR